MYVPFTQRSSRWVTYVIKLWAESWFSFKMLPPRGVNLHVKRKPLKKHPINEFMDISGHHLPELMCRYQTGEWNQALTWLTGSLINSILMIFICVNRLYASTQVNHQMCSDSSKITMSAAHSVLAVILLFTVRGVAPGFVSRLHHHDSLCFISSYSQTENERRTRRNMWIAI